MKLIKSCAEIASKPVTREPTQFCQSDLDALKETAKTDSLGYLPHGNFYAHVADYIDATGFGGIKRGGFNDAIPVEDWADAHDFAHYLNSDGNAEKLGLKNIKGSPYDAPPGSIVVSAPNQIAVKGDGDIFFDGGVDFNFHTEHTLGIFVPTKCSSQSGNMIPYFADHLSASRNRLALDSQPEDEESYSRSFFTPLH